MKWTRLVRALVPVVLLLLTTASAWAQQYYTCTSQSVGSRWVTPPTSGTTTISFTSVDDSNSAAISTPFPIQYWGTSYSSMYVCTNGSLAFNSNQSTTNYSPIALGLASGVNDGIVCVAQRDLYGAGAGAACKYWSDGTAPNRRFIVAWTNWDVFSNTQATLNFQCQFYESGIIVMSYLTGTWTSSSFGVGLDSQTSSQFCNPSASGTSPNPFTITTPVNDYQFASLRITGRVLYDRYVVDASGIGTSIESNLPLAGLTVIERDSTGATIGSGTTDSTGAFTVNGSPVAGASLAVVSASTLCSVRRTATGSPYAVAFLNNYNFASSSPDVGTFSIGEGLDPGGVLRRPLNIARTFSTVYDWVKLRTTKTIQAIDPVVYDPTSSAPSSYTQKNGSTLASMVVAASTSNDDGWDVSILRKLYGRHILGAIAADPGTAFDGSFDKATDDYNAFADGFGHYMNVMVSGNVKYFDGISSNLSTVIDYESPTMTTPFGSNVAGWVAAALFDLTDPANETWDTFNGVGTAGEQVFNTVASMSPTTPVSTSAFFNAWVGKGYDGVGLARNFIHYGLIVDDPDEPNDLSLEATQVTQFGFIRSNRVLNFYNPDWYRFTMPDPTDTLTASVVYDRTRYPTASVLLQLLDFSGNVLATGSPQGSVGPIVATSGALASGDYRVRIELNSGGPIPVYTLQVFSALAFKSGEFQPWTLNRPINVPVNVKGGIPPYNLTVLAPFEKPDGLVLDGVNGRVIGSPTGPQFPNAPISEGGSYTYSFILSAQDAATPANTASGTVSFTVNDIVRNKAGEFIAFAWNKSVNRDAPFIGGTAPYQFSIDQGALPSGMSLSTVPRLRFNGTPDTPGSGIMTLTDEDVAASSATAASSFVVCVPINQTTNLALGASACGFYFDALEGTSVSLAMTTAKKQPVRVLRTEILDSDGFTVVPSRTKVGKGKASVTGFIAPHTGRFYCVVASDIGDSSKITCVGKVVLAKSIAGNNGTRDIKPDSPPFVLDVGALAGTQMTLTLKPDKSGLKLSSTYIVDPSGNYLDVAAEIKASKKDGGFTLTRTLDATGTWKVLVVALPGPQGRFTYSLKLKQPKGVYVEN